MLKNNSGNLPHKLLKQFKIKIKGREFVLFNSNVIGLKTKWDIS